MWFRIGNFAEEDYNRIYDLTGVGWSGLALVCGWDQFGWSEFDILVSY